MHNAYAINLLSTLRNLFTAPFLNLSVYCSVSVSEMFIPVLLSAAIDLRMLFGAQWNELSCVASEMKLCSNQTQLHDNINNHARHYFRKRSRNVR